MNDFNNYQVAQAVNDGLNSMNIPVTQQIANDVMNCIIPFIRNEISMASQSNQAVLALQSTINSLMMENRAQVMQIAKLSQTHQEMPRMFTVNPANGFGYCMDGGKEKIHSESFNQWNVNSRNRDRNAGQSEYSEAD